MAQKFDLQVVHDNFAVALHGDDDVELQSYLESYQELNKFFTLMGTVFGFVSSDLEAKMGILNEYRSGNPSNFRTVKAMIEYEKELGWLHVKHKEASKSGSRTLLRLHRGLDFIRDFLKKLGELGEVESTAQACRDAYESTLAKYHPFLIRNGAKLAMYALPNRHDLLLKVCGSEEEINKAIALLPKTLETTAHVYNRVEVIYTVYNLHNLP